jgi:hypothetical protein
VFSGDVDNLDNWPSTGFFYVKATSRCGGAAIPTEARAVHAAATLHSLGKLTLLIHE